MITILKKMIPRWIKDELRSLASGKKAKGLDQLPIRNPDCSELEIDNWTISRFVVENLVPIVGWHPYPLPELHLMSAAILGLKVTHVFEWGTNIGSSARVFYEISKAFNVGLTIHSVDLPPEIDHVEHPRSERGRLVRNLKGVNLHEGDGLRVSLDLFKAIPSTEKIVPLFFLDGDHSYESVSRELKGILDATGNANILVHDTFNQSSEAGYNIGPYLAIQEMLKSHSGNYRILAQTMGLPGMTLLYKRART